MMMPRTFRRPKREQWRETRCSSKSVCPYVVCSFVCRRMDEMRENAARWRYRRRYMQSKREIGCGESPAPMVIFYDDLLTRHLVIFWAASLGKRCLAVLQKTTSRKSVMTFPGSISHRASSNNVTLHYAYLCEDYNFNCRRMYKVLLLFEAISGFTVAFANIHKAVCSKNWLP